MHYELITAQNESLQSYIERQEVPCSDVSERITPYGYQADFLRRLKLATDDDRWHLRRVNGDGIALCVTVPRVETFSIGGVTYKLLLDGYEVWKCVRAGALDSTMIYYANWHHYRNIKRAIREMMAAEQAREDDHDRKGDDLSWETASDMVDYGMGKKKHFSGTAA